MLTILVPQNFPFKMWGVGWRPSSLESISHLTSQFPHINLCLYCKVAVDSVCFFIWQYLSHVIRVFYSYVLSNAHWIIHAVTVVIISRANQMIRSCWRLLLTLILNFYFFSHLWFPWFNSFWYCWNKNRRPSTAICVPFNLEVAKVDWLSTKRTPCYLQCKDKEKHNIKW